MSKKLFDPCKSNHLFKNMIDEIKLFQFIYHEICSQSHISTALLHLTQKIHLELKKKTFSKTLDD